MSDIREWRHTGSFKAKDPMGNSHTVCVETLFITARDNGPDEPPMANSARFKLLSGEPLGRTGKGEHQVSSSGLILTSDDPAAP